MLTRWNLWETARARLQDAEVLLQSQRYDGAVYVCGYAIEIALKEKICRTLNWPDFPLTGGEFQKYQSFKTHDLDVLLHLSGVEQTIKENMLSQWSAIARWSPEARYNPVGSATVADAEMMIQSAKTLLEVLAQ
jgi:HEPN domain-containing protein